jgi:hypothetical protein
MPGSSAETGDMNNSKDFALEPGAGLVEKTDLSIERRSRLDLQRFGRSGSYVAVRPFFDARLRRGLVCEWGRWGQVRTIPQTTRPYRRYRHPFF